MRSRYPRHRAGVFVVAVVLAMLGAAAAPAGAAGPASDPTVDVGSVAGLAPDGQSVTVGVLASCPERWTVVEAVVAVSQPDGSGRASFPLTCIGAPRQFSVTVAASSGAFRLGDAQATASVLIKRGKTARAEDTQVVSIQPTVLVEIADTAQLLSEGGGALALAVAVACPAGVTGLQSALNVSQGQAIGNGSYMPICDGSRHSFPVEVPASLGTYRVGNAQALTFAVVEHEGMAFYGVDDGTIQITT